MPHPGFRQAYLASFPPHRPLPLPTLSPSSSRPRKRSTAGPVSYTWVARSRSESTSQFTALALNKPSSSSSSSSSPSSFEWGYGARCLDLARETSGSAMRQRVALRWWQKCHRADGANQRGHRASQRWFDRSPPAAARVPRLP